MALHLVDSLEWYIQQKMDMKFGAQNVMSLYRSNIGNMESHMTNIAPLWNISQCRTTSYNLMAWKISEIYGTECEYSDNGNKVQWLLFQKYMLYVCAGFYQK
jgi:hypothetical protein